MEISCYYLQFPFPVFPDDHPQQSHPSPPWHTPAIQKVWQPLWYMRSFESQTSISNSVSKQVQFLTPDKDHGFIEKIHITFQTQTTHLSHT